MKRLLAALAALVCAGCMVGPGSTSHTQLVTIHVDCTMTGAVSPGYKWQLTKNDNTLGRTYGTLPASRHRYAFTANSVWKVDFQLSAIKTPMHGFIKCSALHTGPGKRRPYPIVDSCLGAVKPCTLNVLVA